jgi:DNA-binding GntR family transcriptional regulator
MQEWIDRPNLNTAVQEILRAKILSGELRDGERIVEEKWCQTLGISRSPLKLGLVALAEQGLVRIIPRRGAFVTKLTVEDMIELCQIREALEDLAVDLIVARGAKDGAERLFEAARRYEEEYRSYTGLPEAEKSGGRGNEVYTRMKAEDLAFHRVIMSLSGNRNLLTLMSEGRLQQLTISLADSAPEHPLPGDVAEEHLAIARAIDAEDGGEAKRILRKHLARAVDTLRNRKPEASDG